MSGLTVSSWPANALARRPVRGPRAGLARRRLQRSTGGIGWRTGTTVEHGPESRRRHGEGIEGGLRAARASGGGAPGRGLHGPPGVECGPREPDGRTARRNGGAGGVGTGQRQRERRAGRHGVEGLDAAASSQRPIQPVAVEPAGSADCQMSIERKWLRLGFG